MGLMFRDGPFAIRRFGLQLKFLHAVVHSEILNQYGLWEAIDELITNLWIHLFFWITRSGNRYMGRAEQWKD
jgi:hypothetical protein